MKNKNIKLLILLASLSCLIACQTIVTPEESVEAVALSEVQSNGNNTTLSNNVSQPLSSLLPVETSTPIALSTILKATSSPTVIITPTPTAIPTIVSTPTSTPTTVTTPTPTATPTTNTGGGGSSSGGGSSGSSNLNSTGGTPSFYFVDSSAIRKSNEDFLQISLDTAKPVSLPSPSSSP